MGWSKLQDMDSDYMLCHKPAADSDLIIICTYTCYLDRDIFKSIHWSTVYVLASTCKTLEICTCSQLVVHICVFQQLGYLSDLHVRSMGQV